MSSKLCKICKSPLFGRSDKIFCSVKCKNEYHVKLRRVTRAATSDVDKFLHRNRSILLEIMGKNRTQRKVSRLVLERKKFRFNYATRVFTSPHGEIYHYVYDFAWIDYPDQSILILRKGHPYFTTVSR